MAILGKLFSCIAIIFCIGSVICGRRCGTIRCSNESVCCCTTSKEGTLNADCSRRGLNYAPVFISNVTSINLSHNNIKVFPHHGEIPCNVVYLDLSFNRMDRFQGNPFKGKTKLKYLDLSGNRLIYNKSVYKPNVFDDLKQLKIINLKYNNVNVKVYHYPTAVAKLKNIETLQIDGKKGASFKEEFRSLKNLRELDFSGMTNITTCTISHLQKDLLQYFPSIAKLRFSGCNLRSIEIGSLNYLQNLTYLNLSYNRHLTFRALRNISHDLKFTDIKVLDVSAIHCRYGVGTIIFKDDLIELQNSTLRELYINSNRLDMFDDDFVPALPHSLEIVSLVNNKLSAGTYLLQFNFLKSIKKIFGSFQRYTNVYFFTKLSRLCNDWRASNHLKTLERIRHKRVTNSGRVMSFSQIYDNLNLDVSDKDYINQSTVESLWCYPMPPNLKVIELSDSGYRFVLRPITFCKQNVVEIIKLQNNNIEELIGPLSNLENVKHLDLSNNFCKNISSQFFDGLTNVEILNMSHNLLGNILQYDEKTDIFKNLCNLYSLDLSYNRIRELPPGIFANQRNLAFLNVSYNVLRNWSVNIGHMKHLLYLGLSNNQLTQLDVTTRRDVTLIIKASKLRVDLTNNPLLCNCESQDFLMWIYKYRETFYSFEKMQCSLNNNSKVSFRDLQMVLFPYLQKQCSNFGFLLVGTSFAILFCIFILITSVVYRFRWKLRYLYYLTKSRYLGHSTTSKKTGYHDYEYDAFISYATEDNEFINLMVNKLEMESNYHLCIHERDFLPGVPIADNITTVINNSRKIIVILSANYLSSYWCMFELNMARMESIYSREGANVLILVFYEDLEARDIPLYLMDLIKSKTYLEYPRDPDGGDIVFWNKIVQAITL